MESIAGNNYINNSGYPREGVSTLFAQENVNSIRGDNGDGIIEPLPVTRINEMVQYVGSKKSTWTELREQYPPSQSCLAPSSNILNGNTNAFAGTGSFELDNSLSADAVIRQAATMAAYGVGFLQSALDSAQVDRKHFEEASAIFATLCATLWSTLTDSRNQGSDEETNGLGEKGGAYRDKQDMAVESEAVLDTGEAVPISDTTQRINLGEHRQGGRVSRQKSSKRSQQYSRGHRNSETLVSQKQQQLYNRDAGREDELVAAESANLIESNTMPGEGVDSIGNRPAADLAIPVAARPKYVMPAALPDMFTRRKVIRRGLMSLRLSGSAITAYFGQFSRCTSNIYDSMWEYWAKWCLRNGINPCERSAMILNMFIYEIAKGEDWKTTAKLQIEAIWSIVEGQPQPERGRAGTNYARY